MSPFWRHVENYRPGQSVLHCKMIGPVGKHRKWFFLWATMPSSQVVPSRASWPRRYPVRNAKRLHAGRCRRTDSARRTASQRPAAGGRGS